VFDLKIVPIFAPNLKIYDMAILFWTLLGILIFTYFGYGVLMAILVSFKRIFSSKKVSSITDAELPEVTFLVAAWNEKDWIENKIQNSLQFNYPSNKLHLYFVTDGTNDGTDKLIENFSYPEGTQWKLFHKNERAGKIAAVERVMPFVQSPIVIYSDANTDVNSDAIKNIVSHYKNPKVGGVAGEKRVSMAKEDSAAGSEGIYWKYESFLKRMDSELYSVVGAAGELFSIRTNLFENVPKDTLVEDFVLTMGIAAKGYKIVYEPEAYAVEGSSASVGEELKRKIRIAAGGLQALWRLRQLFNIFKYGVLSFQFIGHRVLRWTIAPLALPVLFFLNIPLALENQGIYAWLLALQTLFYLFALLGWIFENRKIRFRAFFIPYYFCVMNYAMFKGLQRLMKGSQSVLWEKAKRAS
jgi:cellulose synthase/poly-beta-1,6-N-acetylglucosamine synthase-like glycosyltransferase